MIAAAYNLFVKKIDEFYLMVMVRLQTNCQRTL